MKHILITPDYPTNALIEPLCRRGFRVTVVGTKKELNYLGHSGCDFLAPKALTPSSLLGEIAQVLKALKTQLREEDLFQFHGKSLLESISTADGSLLEAQLLQARLTLDAVQRLHCQRPIELVIVHEEVSLQNRALLAFAKSFSLPTLHVPHANMLRDSLPRSNLHSVLYSDYQVFGSTWCADRYSHLLRPAHFAVTGNPEFDAYAAFDLSQRKREARRRLKIHEDQKLVTFLSSAGWPGMVEKSEIDEGIRRSYRTLLQMSRSLDFALICKLHPDSDENLHQKVEAEAQSRPFLRTCENFMDGAAVADWVVVYGPSNSIIEAVLMGQKVIVIDAFENEPGVVSVRSDPAEIERTLERALRGDFDKEIASGREKFIQRFNMDNDGRAAQRVVEFIESILSITPKQKEDYYGLTRRELAEKVPPGAKVILEVGCGKGATGNLIKGLFPQTKVIGIEKNPSSALEAKKCLDEAYAVDVSQVDLNQLGFSSKSIDCLIYGDVLEHLANPWEVLKRHVEFLSDSGRIILSIPNVGCITVFDQLRKGRWPYQESGIFDKTHLRFFTRTSLIDLLNQAGLQLESLDRRKALELPRPKGFKILDWPHFSLKGLTREEIEDLETEQFIAVARKGHPKPAGGEPTEPICNYSVEPVFRRRIFHRILNGRFPFYQQTASKIRFWMWKLGFARLYPDLRKVRVK